MLCECRAFHISVNPRRHVAWVRGIPSKTGNRNVGTVSAQGTTCLWIANNSHFTVPQDVDYQPLLLMKRHLQRSAREPIPRSRRAAERVVNVPLERYCPGQQLEVNVLLTVRLAAIV